MFTATLAGARALDLEERVGNLDAGKEADFVVIDPQRQDLLTEILARIDVDDTERLVFTLLMGMREEAIAAVYVNGRRVSPASPAQRPTPDRGRVRRRG